MFSMSFVPGLPLLSQGAAHTTVCSPPGCMVLLWEDNWTRHRKFKVMERETSDKAGKPSCTTDDSVSSMPP